MAYDRENRMASFAEDATLNACDSDGFKRVETVGLEPLQHHLPPSLRSGFQLKLRQIQHCQSSFVA
jgi:hypothetical protein